MRSQVICVYLFRKDGTGDIPHISVSAQWMLDPMMTRDPLRVDLMAVILMIDILQCSTAAPCGEDDDTDRDCDSLI